MLRGKETECKDKSERNKKLIYLSRQVLQIIRKEKSITGTKVFIFKFIHYGNVIIL